MHTYEEIAYSRGQRHDVGSASFYRPFTPRGAAHWVEKIFNADWTDPSNPIRDGTTTTEAPRIAEAITPFYETMTPCMDRKSSTPPALKNAGQH